MKIATDISAIVSSKKQIDAINRSTALISFNIDGIITDAKSYIFKNYGI